MRKPFMIVVLSISMAVLACASETSDHKTNPVVQNPVPPGQGVEPSNPGVVPPAGEEVVPPPVVLEDGGLKVPTNQAECIAVCEATHPEGTQLGRAISNCWENFCKPSCTLMEDRLNHNVGPVVPDGGKACGVPELPVLTPSPSCSNCTNDKCCAPWAACFSSLESDCTKLNQCASECWAKFPN